MQTITRGRARPTGEGDRRSRLSLAVSVGVNLVVLSLFLQAAAVHGGWYETLAKPRGDVPAERISFIRLPAGPTTQAGKSGGDGRPASRADRPARPAPRFVAPTTATVPPPRPAEPEAPAGRADAPPGPGGSGEIVGDGGPTAGMRPTFADPRLWQRPENVVSAPKSAKERVDSVIADRLGPVRDSIAAAQALAAGQRRPGDWTFKGKGGTWGMDQQSIHLGKIKVPNALLGLLSANLQKSLRSNPNEIANERRLAQARQEIMDHAQRGMAEDDFRGAVKAIRARKDRERNERLAERRRAAEAAVAADGGASAVP